MPTPCPKCGFERTPGDEECPKCGVIFAKAAATQNIIPKSIGEDARINTDTSTPAERSGGDAVKPKSLPMAIGLNFVLPGMGYMYMGKVIVGIAACLLVVSILATSGLFIVVPTWVGLNVIMGIDMVILSGKRKKAVAAATTMPCPQCAETIQRAAKVCRFCGVKLD